MPLCSAAFADPAKLGSSASLDVFGSPVRCLPGVCLLRHVAGEWRQPISVVVVTSSGKKTVEVTTKGIQKDEKRRLSQILRTEAAIGSVQRKAGFSRSGRLWPKAVLEALSQSIEQNQWESALRIFGLLRIQHWYTPKCQTYVQLFKMLGRCRLHGQASELFRLMLSEGLKPTVDVYTSLMGVYGLSGRLDEAFRVLDEMKTVCECKPDVYAYTLLINCCSKSHRFDLINKLLTEMSYLGFDCSIVTYNTIIDGYGKMGKLELMEELLMDMLEGGKCLPDIYTMNSFLWAYGNAGQIEKMETWYQEFQVMGIEPDLTTFNILIKSYGKSAIYEKIGLVLEFMKRRFFSPETVTYNIIIEIFGKAGNIQQMEYFFDVMKKQGMKPNCITYTSLITGYSKAGRLDKFGTILRQINNSNVVLDTTFFNSIISAYGRAGELKAMKQMFGEMKRRKCQPDDITFASMVQAYDARGMIEAAKELETEAIRIQRRSTARSGQGKDTEKKGKGKKAVRHSGCACGDENIFHGDCASIY
ncbi:Pentatricopeptide repeat-containing protein [Nymphaea thermarum]|nr:Pentatricopeptide repeat-containing protein [Nymphaea thermarum]